MTQDEASRVAFLAGIIAEVVIQLTIAANPAAKELIDAFHKGNGAC